MIVAKKAKKHCTMSTSEYANPRILVGTTSANSGKSQLQQSVVQQQEQPKTKARGSNRCFESEIKKNGLNENNPPTNHPPNPTTPTPTPRHPLPLLVRVPK
jgi:hypothetical protein